MGLKPCSKAGASARLKIADTYMTTAEFARELEDTGNPYRANSVITNYVHAGIAAADAICCYDLGEHSEGRNHADATKVLSRVRPDGKVLAKSLKVLIDIKTRAGYGSKPLAATEALRAQRSAEKLIQAARAHLN